MQVWSGYGAVGLLGLLAARTGAVGPETAQTEHACEHKHPLCSADTRVHMHFPGEVHSDSHASDGHASACGGRVR